MFDEVRVNEGLFVVNGNVFRYGRLVNLVLFFMVKNVNECFV